VRALPGAAAVAAVLAAILVAACGVSPTADPPPATRVLSDADGAIGLALMVVSSPRRSSLRNQLLVETVVQRLDPRTRVVILAHPDMVLDPNPLPGRMSFVEISDELDFSIWPQDPFVVLRGADGAGRLLAARDYGRGSDRQMARVVADHLGWPVEESSLFFAGGNIVADSSRAFIGSNLVRENVADLGLLEEDVVERFREELGVPVFVLGGEHQPIEHLDMVVTPLGGGRFAVADSATGADIAQRALSTTPDVVRGFEERAELEFFGDPAVRSVTDREDRVVVAPSVVGGLARAVADSRAIASGLDAIADDLSALGYEVLRIPLVAPKGEGAERALEPGYPVLSYNNVLLDPGDDASRVYVPEYGLQALDSAAVRAWTEAGFEVHPISGVTTSAMYRGSVRCTIKVLERNE
jgi:hypothetical protein